MCRSVHALRVSSMTLATGERGPSTVTLASATSEEDASSSAVRARLRFISDEKVWRGGGCILYAGGPVPVASDFFRLCE